MICLGLPSEVCSLLTAKVSSLCDEGIIRSITINDAPVGRSVDETLRTLKAFLYTDKNGVVCPANWQPGSKTIIPDQEKKVEYFKEL